MQNRRKANHSDLHEQRENRKEQQVLRSDRTGRSRFQRQFTTESYERFFRDAGYDDVQILLADGRIPCAAAVMTKKAEKK